jgi:hypothetical protein
VTIDGNLIDLRFGKDSLGKTDDTQFAKKQRGVHVDSIGLFPPVGIRVENNRIYLKYCTQEGVKCSRSGCIREEGNVALRDGAFTCD